MDNSVLLDFFITKHADKLDKTLYDTKDDCYEDKQKIIELLHEKDQKLISRFEQGLLNTFQIKSEQHLLEALNLGFLLGMEIKEMMLKFDDII